MDQGRDAEMLRKASDTWNKFSSLAAPSNIFQVTDSGASGRSKFPVQLGSTDAEDEKYSLRKKFVGAGGNVEGVGLALAGDDYFNYMERKREQANLFEFMKYVMSQADLSKPETAEWWYNKFPWMKTMRLKEIDRIASVQKRLAEINVAGPQSEEDFMFIYMLKKGLLGDELLGKPIHLLNETNGAAYPGGNQFKYGMWSLLSRSEKLLIDYPGVTAATGERDNADALVNWAEPLGAYRATPGGSVIPSSLTGVDYNSRIRALAP